MSNTPTLRFGEFDGEWSEKNFKDLTKINQGLQISISERYIEKVEDSYFYITNEFLKKGSDKQYFIKNPSQSVLCTEKDVLMTRTGNTGQVVTNVNGAFHNNFFKIKYDERLDKDFLVYFLKSVKTQNTIMRLAGTSTIPDLNHGDFYRIKIQFPSKQEQQKIATFLSAVDSSIEQLSKKEQLLRSYKKGVMQKIFSREIRFTRDDGGVFEDWVEKRLGDIAKITTGKLDANAMIENGKYRFYTCAKDYFNIDDFAFDTDALIISGNGANVGYIHHYKGKFNAYQRTYVLDNFSDNIIYIKYFLDKYLYRRILQEKNEGNTPYIVMGTLTDMKINLPSLPEQTKIANFLSSLDKQIVQVSEQLAEKKDFKKGLLQKMFV